MNKLYLLKCVAMGIAVGIALGYIFGSYSLFIILAGVIGLGVGVGSQD